MVNLPLVTMGSNDTIDEFLSAKSASGVLFVFELDGGSEPSPSSGGGGTRLLGSVLRRGCLGCFVGEGCSCLGGSMDDLFTVCQSSSSSLPAEVWPVLCPLRNTLNRLASLPSMLVRFSFFSGGASNEADSTGGAALLASVGTPRD